MQLEGIYTGVHTDALEPEPGDMGAIDLALTLEQAGDNVSGYVLLQNTLVFTQEHTLAGARAVGPPVSGTFDGTTLRLVSEKSERTLSAGRTLPEGGRILPERTATRQFGLVSNEVISPGLTLAGVYRETMWGLTPEPVTVVGSFTLQRPDSGPVMAMRLYLPLVVKRYEDRDRRAQFPVLAPGLTCPGRPVPRARSVSDCWSSLDSGLGPAFLVLGAPVRRDLLFVRSHVQPVSVNRKRSTSSLVLQALLLSVGTADRLEIPYGFRETGENWLAHRA